MPPKRREYGQQSSIARIKVVRAGEPAELKNGDVLLLGSDSQMRVHITPASDESTTVEQHLRAECEMLMQRVQVSMPPRFLMITPYWERSAARRGG